MDAVSDPRPGGARRHRTRYVLAVLAAAFASAGFATFTGAAQWAAATGPGLLACLGARPDPFTGQIHPPSEATLHRIAGTVAPGELEAVIAAWAAASTPAPDPPGSGSPRAAVAIDGKTVRGAKRPGAVTPHLLSAATHHTPVVLTQRQDHGQDQRDFVAWQHC